MTYDDIIILVYKKQGFHPLFRRYIFGKTTGVSNWPPVILGLINYLSANPTKWSDYSNSTKLDWLDFGPFYINCRKFINRIFIVSMATKQYHHVLQCITIPGDRDKVRRARIGILKLQHWKKWGTIRDHSFSTYAKFSEKITFLTHWYAHVRVRIRELEMLFFQKILRTY